jgi:putative solute:sodium symporter small subunit
MEKEDKAVAYWKANIRLIGIMLAIWAFVSYGMGIFFYRAAPDFYLPGFQIPLGFWFAHQGAMFVFVILIIVYAKLMDGIDEQYDVKE